MKKGYLVLEDGKTFSGEWIGNEPKVGEVVFNTSHSGYEEIATDPSYYSQIMVMTSSQQGNYGISDEVWESSKVWIEGFVCLDLQSAKGSQDWQERLKAHNVPILNHVDTRRLTLYLRDRGTPWGALLKAESPEQANVEGQALIQKIKSEKIQEKDWPHLVSTQQIKEFEGDLDSGPRVAVIDFGCKNNIIRELQKRCSKVGLFPSRVQKQEIEEWRADGVLLSNGPGDPSQVENSVDNIKEMLGWKPIFGICMGHQLLSLSLGAKTFKLKFGHRGSNHPIEDQLLNKVYMTSQNHGYAVQDDSLKPGVKVTHRNLNDMTIAGISCDEKKCFSVQFHPESHPGPRDSSGLFDFFVERLL